ncbi:hypothetical protein KY284_032974 [Solanum tuberosum]|nr:hypothetical protein KY284_032974 [Solanum tuberosum]
MSDKQKGLIEAFDEVLPSVSRRFCLRHLHNNFKRAGFSGSSLKCALWATASATTVEFFNARINDIVKLDAEVVVWLKEKEPTEWSKSHFSSNTKCDILLNNMCESFNSMILDARDKPSITLLEKSNAAGFIPKKSNEWNFEILGGSVSDIWAVDFAGKKWTITGIPCKHAISAIWHKNDELWPKSGKIPPLPSIFSRQNKSGRKQKLRRKEQNEVGSSRTKMKKKQTSVNCSQCHKFDHNTRTCKFNYVQPEGGVFESACWMPSISFVPEKLPVRRTNFIHDANVASSDMNI